VFSTGFPENGVTLSSVLSKAAVNEVDEIVSDWGIKDIWHWEESIFLFISSGVDSDGWSRGHFVFLIELLNMNDL
jgi:hypothetical protein